MSRLFLVIGALLGLLAVAAGAFGAHALRGMVPPDLLAVFETGARYQMYHALALLAVAWLSSEIPSPWITASGWLFVVGTVLFSGSLYALALTSNNRLGLITPLGGVAFMAGWASLGIGAWLGRRSKPS